MNEKMTQREWDRVVGWGNPPTEIPEGWTTLDEATNKGYRIGEFNLIMTSRRTGMSKLHSERYDEAKKVL